MNKQNKKSASLTLLGIVFIILGIKLLAFPVDALKYHTSERRARFRAEFVQMHQKTLENLERSYAIEMKKLKGAGVNPGPAWNDFSRHLGEYEGTINQFNRLYVINNRLHPADLIFIAGGFFISVLYIVSGAGLIFRLKYSREGALACPLLSVFQYLILLWKTSASVYFAKKLTLQAQHLIQFSMGNVFDKEVDGVTIFNQFKVLLFFEFEGPWPAVLVTMLLLYVIIIVFFLSRPSIKAEF